MRCIALLSFLFLSLFGQAQVKNLNFGINHFSGKMLKHTSKINVTTPIYQTGIEFSYRKQTQGNKAWQQRFGYPETALNLLLAKNGPESLGYTIGLYPSIQFNIKEHRRWRFFGKIGGGVGLVTKHWSRLPAEDTVNNIIGGLVNNVTMFQVGMRYFLATHWSVQSGFDFYHASNASARQPNFGINTYGLFLGLTYHPKGYQHPFIHLEENPSKRKMSYGMRFAYARAEDKIADGPMFSAYSICFFGQRSYRQKGLISLGIDGTYFEKLYAIFRNNGNFKNQEQAHAWRYSLFAGHEFIFGKIGFPVQLGFYLNRPIQGPYIYQKLGLNYHLYRNPNKALKDVFLMAHLKTHLLQAEQAEFGFGFSF